MFEGLFAPAHLLIILVIVLIIFGPGKLPQIGGELGKGIKAFKKAISDEEKRPDRRIEEKVIMQDPDEKMDSK